MWDCAFFLLGSLLLAFLFAVLSVCILLMVVFYFVYLVKDFVQLSVWDSLN